jgi:CENP-B N-terminal DNA-binding domain
MSMKAIKTYNLGENRVLSTRKEVGELVISIKDTRDIHKFVDLRAHRCLSSFMQHIRMDRIRDRRSRLSLDRKLSILRLLSKGHTQCSLARRFHTTQPTISKILANRKAILKLAKKGNGEKHNSKNVEYSTDSEEGNEATSNDDDDDSNSDDDDDDGYESRKIDGLVERKSKMTKSTFNSQFMSHLIRYVSDILEDRLQLDEYLMSELCRQKDNLYRLVCDSTSLSVKRAILQNDDLLRVLTYPLFEFYENINS